MRALEEAGGSDAQTKKLAKLNLQLRPEMRVVLQWLSDNQLPDSLLRHIRVQIERTQQSGRQESAAITWLDIEALDDKQEIREAPTVVCCARASAQVGPHWGRGW